ncbi:uncharacterized protein LOC101737341 [Bombyx mori]|uniref:Cuticle protein n=1 Tax=Bombyx mori TaxID=7091 RepID=A0A8R2APN8_BOMMO|nr:uncharacterized protein LOC101737341 [Bombyx mori]XP_037873602.1 uncharacterized protein LOC101737341 [Bombyx mori]
MGRIRVIFVCVSIILSSQQSYAQCPDTALASLLRQILTPSKAPMAIQAIKSAAEDTGRTMFAPEMIKSRRVIVPSQNMFEPIAVPREREIVPLSSIVPANDCPIRILANEIARAPIEVRVLPNEFPCDCQRTLTRPRVECQTQSVIPFEQYPVNEFYRSAPVVNYMSPQMYPERQPAGNPYLPIASPISALSTTSSNFLPPPTQARSHFLRKVPIPPPTL